MRVREAMTRPAKTIRGEDTVRDAARHMRDLGVGALPVFEGKQLAGVITDRDITTRVTAEERNPAATPVADVMTRGALSCYEDQTVAEAAKMMVDEGVRRLVVVDRREEVVGVISVDDLAVLVSDEALAGAEILPAPPDP